VLVDVTLDGVTVPCLVDTGADAVFVLEDTVAAGAPGELLAVDVLEIGGVTSSDPLVAVAEPDFLAALAEVVGLSAPLACVLGYRGWPTAVVLLDWDAERVWLGDDWSSLPERGPPEAELYLSFGDPVPLAYAGIEGELEPLSLLDTGAGPVVLTQAWYDRLSQPPALEAGTAATADGVLSVGLGTLGEVSLGGVVHEDVALAVFDVPQLEVFEDIMGVEIGAIVGADVLTRQAMGWHRGDAEVWFWGSR
jgi:predicted aspartyl protease